MESIIYLQPKLIKQSARKFCGRHDLVNYLLHVFSRDWPWLRIQARRRSPTFAFPQRVTVGHSAILKELAPPYPRSVSKGYRRLTSIFE
jgi:hypothetical protein